jgi:CPA2 family monovalent cation:H+ antiporter-2
MAIFELTVGMPFIGNTLMESQLRENYGINVAVIKRDDLIINVPKRSERLYPNDILSVIGTDEQLKNFKDFIEVSLLNKPETSEIISEVSLHHFTLNESSAFIGKSISETDIRDITKGLVVGVERNDERILNPESDLIFKAEDTIWLVGDEKRIQFLIIEQEKSA